MGGGSVMGGGGSVMDSAPSDSTYAL
jgi:hypothetical protein